MSAVAPTLIGMTLTGIAFASASITAALMSPQSALKTDLTVFLSLFAALSGLFFAFSFMGALFLDIVGWLL
jgi:hypothetical protein